MPMDSMKTHKISYLALILAANVAFAQEDSSVNFPYPEVSHRFVIADDAVQELLRQGDIPFHEATLNGVAYPRDGKCSGPDFNKKWPACNHGDLQFFPEEADCPGKLAIVTGGSGTCQNTGGLNVPLVDFYGDDWSSFWASAQTKRCRTQDTYQVGEFQQDGTSGVTATATTLWQVRPWKQSGKPLPPGFDEKVEWMEAQCSGFLEVKTFGYNGD